MKSLKTKIIQLLLAAILMASALQAQASLILKIDESQSKITLASIVSCLSPCVESPEFSLAGTFSANIQERNGRATLIALSPIDITTSLPAEQPFSLTRLAMHFADNGDFSSVSSGCGSLIFRGVCSQVATFSYLTGNFDGSTMRISGDSQYSFSGLHRYELVARVVPALVSASGTAQLMMLGLIALFLRRL